MTSRDNAAAGVYMTMTPSLRLGACAVIALCSAAAAGTTPVQPDPNAVLAERIAGELARHPFGTSRADWRRKAPDASWRQHRGNIGYLHASRGIDPEGMWCAIASEAASDVTREAVFYAIRNGSPLDCRLEQLQYVSGGASPDARKLYEEIDRVLSARYGSAEPLRRPGPSRGIPGLPDGSDSDSWDDVRRWRAGRVEIFLSRTFDEKTVVFVRTEILIETLREARSPSVAPRSPFDALDAEFQTALRRLDSEAAELRSPPGDFERTKRAALRLLDAEKKARRAEDRFVLNRAADSLIANLWATRLTEDPRERPELAELAAIGLEYDYRAHGDTWYIGLTPARKRQPPPRSRWAELLEADDIMSPPGCDGDESAPAIALGERWLKLYPKSEFRAAVTQALAAAYETRWSLSLRPPEEEFAPEEPPVLDPSARTKAIEWHRRLISRYPASVEAQRSKRNLMHLELNVDTGQRRYYCVIP